MERYRPTDERPYEYEQWISRLRIEAVIFGGFLSGPSSQSPPPFVLSHHYILGIPLFKLNVIDVLALFCAQLGLISFV